MQTFLYLENEKEYFLNAQYLKFLQTILISIK